MKDYGPTRRETQLYLGISLVGLVILGLAVGLRGVGGIAAIEVVGIAGAFFGGTTIWAIRRLWRMR
ncbi:hypothetical protein JANAI62_33970 [Jannaschia pagri]|uniref:PEP-CTERM protein-sorting domain-containing protein n=1 Tax=Jannaschia pagri TaxID=2829797 RepID=A0ABQ4NQT5_9RHOB|nr:MULTISPECIES: hypothetical protein [unclassified Jannaschia]GIT92939.1 hypothetical protein JANAI61_33970 [Jannaschia sp. AI_61]GIT96774.1 hypothetical protein JANAI62_33970 [Jannaschia sp. AI_62]